MRKEVCEQLIAEAEQFGQKMGGDFYEVMKKAPQVVEKWKGHLLPCPGVLEERGHARRTHGIFA